MQTLLNMLDFKMHIYYSTPNAAVKTVMSMCPYVLDNSKCQD